MIGIILNSICLNAQVPTYQCELGNDSLLTSQMYEFDIYLKNTSSVTFELANFQAGFIINPLIMNGGTLGVTIIPGSSQINSSQQPFDAMFSEQENCLKIAPKSPPAFSTGSLIASSGSGTKICRIRVTNSVPFGQAKPNLIFNFTVFPYNTVVSAFDRTTQMNVNITNAASHITSNLANPLLNYPLFVYDLSGSGAYCEGTTGLNVTLGGSQMGMKYQLFKNGNKDGAEVTGSDSSIIWTNRMAGNYTVTGRRPATYMNAIMNGSAVVTEITLPLAAGAISGPNTVQQGQINVNYNIPAIVNATGYTWSLPPYATITSGANTNNIAVSFSPTASSGNINVFGTNSICNGPPSADFPVTVQIASQLSLTNILINNGQLICYNATQTLIVAGNGTFFEVANGGSVTLIAGQNIQMLPGVLVDPGGYLHGYITSNSQYCIPASQPNIFVEKSTIDDTIKLAKSVNLNLPLFTVYPNPTNGKITIALNPELPYSSALVHVYNLFGSEALTDELGLTKLKEISLLDLPKGIYLMQVIIGNQVGTTKIIKL